MFGKTTQNKNVNNNNNNTPQKFNSKPDKIQMQ